MKGFFIEITNNLLEAKHRQAMRESVWLFMWLLDRMTSISEGGMGKILGGKPIKPGEIIRELGISERTYWRWINLLKKHNYIQVRRTSFGCVIFVNKAKKRFGRSVRNGTSELPNMALTKKTINSKTYTSNYNLKRYRELKERYLNAVSQVSKI